MCRHIKISEKQRVKAKVSLKYTWLFDKFSHRYGHYSWTIRTVMPQAIYRQPFLAKGKRYLYWCVSIFVWVCVWGGGMLKKNGSQL